MLPVKPALRCSVSEWNNNNLQLWAEAQQQRQVSGEIRQECRSLRNETHSKVGSCFVWEMMVLIPKKLTDAPLTFRRSGMRRRRLGVSLSVSGMSPDGGTCCRAALRKWMKRWMLWRWWFIEILLELADLFCNKINQKIIFHQKIIASIFRLLKK